MDPGYETVVDMGAMFGSLIAMVVPAVFMAIQLGLAIFLIASGLYGAVVPDGEASWGRRLGATHLGDPAARRYGLVRMVLGLALLAPVLLGAPFVVSLLAGVGAMGLLFTIERGIGTAGPGRWVRWAAIGSAGFVAAIIGFERGDAIDLGTELIASTNYWRAHELEWQLDHDRRSPKVGDLAPDFELQDPSGETAVRLSDFRGKRPVALVFGSYT
jgi:hypothetical protein